MSKFSYLNKVLCGHDWSTIEEWAGAIRTLASLKDDDIPKIESGNERRSGPERSASDSDD